MESPKRITKSQLLEMVRKEVEIQERKKLLENKIEELNNEIYILSEGESGKKKKKDEDEIEEGWLKNAGQALSRGMAGASGVFKGMQQNYQKGADQKSIEQMTSDIKQKEQELAQLKNSFKYVTGKSFNAKNSQNAVALPRNKQGVVKAPAKKKTTVAPATTTAAPAQTKKAPTKVAPTKVTPAKKVTTKKGVTANPVQTRGQKPNQKAAE